MHLLVNNTSDLKEAANTLLAFAGNNHFFIFEGEMGAGKTTFIKEICNALGVKDLVSSPTFSIVNEYDANGKPLYHFDFYRLKSIQEAYDIGYEDYFYSGDYCLVEWPEKVEGLLPDAYILVSIKIKSQSERELTFTKNAANVPVL